MLGYSPSIIREEKQEPKFLQLSMEGLDNSKMWTATLHSEPAVSSPLPPSTMTDCEKSSEPSTSGREKGTRSSSNSNDDLVGESSSETKRGTISDELRAKREYNRKSAQRSRERKRQLFRNLQEQVDEQQDRSKVLQRRNSTLRAIVREMLFPEDSKKRARTPRRSTDETRKVCIRDAAPALASMVPRPVTQSSSIVVPPQSSPTAAVAPNNASTLVETTILNALLKQVTQRAQVPPLGDLQLLMQQEQQKIAKITASLPASLFLERLLGNCSWQHEHQQSLQRQSCTEDQRRQMVRQLLQQVQSQPTPTPANSINHSNPEVVMLQTIQSVANLPLTPDSLSALVEALLQNRVGRNQNG